MQLSDEIEQLKSELSLLRNQQFEKEQYYQHCLDDFSLKLAALSYSVTPSSEQSADHSTAYVPEKDAEISTAQRINDLGLQLENNQLIFKANNQVEMEAENEVSLDDKPQLSQENQASKEVASELTSGLVEQFSELVFAPFTPLFSKVSAFYHHYQERGLAAVFLMTIAGIITLTLGFTYLLQYSFNNWLSEIGKVSFAFISANILLALGVYIYKRRAQMQDFASGLVGLGLIINYVSAYFSGPYFHLIADWMSLFLLLIISLFGFFLSFKFETKVVAILSLVGGSLAPIMLFNSAGDQLIYLPYLLVIGGCALLQSRLLHWPLLIELTAFLHIACVEFFIISQYLYFEQLSIMALVGLLSINLMFYLYGFSGLFWLKESTGKQLVLNKRLLVLPIALFAFTLITISQLTAYSGHIFLFNALLFILVYLKLKPPSVLKVFALLLAGSFAGFAALQLLEQSLLGMVLFAEGLALLYLGYKALYQSIRIEAYVLITIGLVSHFYSLAEMINLPYNVLSDVSEYGVSLLYLVISAATLYTTATMLKQLTLAEQQSAFESKLFIVFRECLSINYVCLIMYIAAIFSLGYALNVIPLISLLLLYLAKKEQLKFSEMLAWLMLLPLIGAVAIGIIDAGSAHFSLQPLYAKLARVELLVCFIGFYYWYKRFYSGSGLLKLARFFQIACFVILPLLFLPKVLRIYPEYLSLALWLSVLISLALAFISRSRLLFFEAKLLVMMAVLITAVSCLIELWQGFLALTLGAMLFAYLYYAYLKLPRFIKLLLRFQWLFSPFYFALVAVVVVHSAMSLIGLPNWGIVMATLVVYFSWLLTIRPMPLVLHNSVGLCLLLIVVPSIVILLLHVENGLNVSINSLLFMGAETIVLLSLRQLFVDNGVALRLITKKFARLYLQWAWHLLFSVCYLLWSYQFTAMVAAPLSAILLVIHGSILMFVSLQVGQTNTIKLAASFFAIACCKILFFDMANFLIIQKVIAFMLIGGILLAVSYFYQKMKNQQQVI